MFEEFKGKKFNIIYADPPWTYKDKALAGNRGAGCKYNTMSLNDIKILPVRAFTADDCALFLWVTWPLLEECKEVIKFWGFEYKTLGFIWIKLNKKKLTPFMGMGNWTRANSEACLFATKGKPKRIDAGVHSVVMAPIGRHSEKPNEVRQRIVQLLGNLPRIELFARNRYRGWSSWGDEL